MAVCSLSARPYYCGSLGKGFFKEEYSKNLLVSAAAGIYRSDFLFELPFYGEVVPLMSLKGSAALVDGAKPIPSLFYSLRLIPAENLAHITGFTGFGYSFAEKAKASVLRWVLDLTSLSVRMHWLSSMPGFALWEKLMGCFCELEVDIVNENPFIT